MCSSDLKVKPTGDKALVDQQRLELAMQAEALFKPASTKSKNKAPSGTQEASSETPAEVTPEVTTEFTTVVTTAVAPEASVDAPQEVSSAVTPSELPITDAPSEVPAMGGRKMQEALRNLREAWKKVDKQAAPNPALWKRFDAACNKAHVVVDAWLKEARAQTAANKAQRLA